MARVPIGADLAENGGLTDTTALEHASAEARSAAYLAAALDCVIMADSSGRVVDFNPAAERTFGYTREQAVGRPIADLIVPPALRDLHRRAYARFVTSGEATLLGRRLELTGMRADGSEFPVELTLSRVEGEPLLVCGALRDLSDAKRAEAHLRRLVDEQAALRHVATLVARATTPAEVFAAVAEEAARILDVPLISVVRFELDETAIQVGAWGHENPFAVGTRWKLDERSVSAQVARTGRPARVDDYCDVPGEIAARLRDVGIRSSVGCPILVGGRLWGVVMALSSAHRPLPEDTETRLAGFTELVATAISNTQARDDLGRLVDEQTALRRLATLVAHGAAPSEVFAAVAEEVGLFVGADVVNIVRHEADDTATAVASWSAIGGTIPLGTRLPLVGPSIMGTVARTGRPMRIDDYSGVPGAITYVVEGVEIRAGVGVPIVVDGRVWGTVVALSANPEPLPPFTESRLADFTELVATAISNTQARNDLRGLADEQAALRRVATLVAREAAPADIFAAVAEEVSGLLGGTMIEIVRCDPKNRATGVGAWGDHPFTVGSQWTLDGPSVIAAVVETGRPARIDDYADLSGSIAAFARDAGFRSAVGAPIMVDGKVWGVVNAISRDPETLPVDTETRLAGFTELVATAIANTEARDELRKSEELYRRAISQAGAVPYVLDYASGAYTFIGDGIEQLTGYAPAELSHDLFGSLVLETYLHGEQASLDERDAAYRTRDGEFARWRTDLRIRRRNGEIRWLSDASVEIFGDDGRSVGSIGMLQDITERMRTDEERLRLAAILEATTDVVALMDPDGRALYMNRAGRRLLGLGLQEDISALKMSDFQPPSSVARVFEEGVPVATRDGVWSGENALLARDGREIPVSQVILAHKDAHGQVTFLSGIARDMTERRELEARLRRTEQEQAALRRVATLVAREASPAEVFDAVAAEVAHVLEIPLTSILSYEPDGTATKVGGSGLVNPYPVGARFPPHAGVITDVRRSGGPARVDDYSALANPVAARLTAAGIRSSVGVPVIVDGKAWGVMVALSTAAHPLPEDTEARLADFTELIATAIANTQAREELRRLLDEQRALRRVATIVAGGAESRGVFDAVCEETGRLLGATSVNLARFTSDGINHTMAGWSLDGTHVPTGTRLPLEGETVNVLVRRTRAPARVDNYERVEGELAALIRQRGIRWEIGAPVIVETEVWGALIAGWDTDEESAERTELRLASFAELVATAVSNATNRAELIASRARIVAAADEARRRIERDLHDGTQQQLVSLGLELKAVEAAIPEPLSEMRADIDRLRSALDAVVDDVRHISQGVHPATLSHWGLGPALRAVVRRSVVPVELEIDVPGRLPESVEIASYYVVSEALANVAKHAEASFAAVQVSVSDGWLRATIRDDGVGGANTDRGSGLTGLVDRVEALGGRLSVTSPPREGTTVVAALPLTGDAFTAEIP
jgi:PAS domain S-box-containing protein